LAHAEDPAERLVAGIRSLVRTLASDPAGARVILIEVVGATPAIERARLEARERFAEILTVELRGVPEWRRRSDDERRLIAVATMGAVAESLSHLSAGRLFGDTAKVAARLSEYVLRALTPAG
jgi:hypothetical protein